MFTNHVMVRRRRCSSLHCGYEKCTYNKNIYYKVNKIVLARNMHFGVHLWVIWLRIRIFHFLFIRGIEKFRNGERGWGCPGQFDVPCGYQVVPGWVSEEKLRYTFVIWISVFILVFRGKFSWQILWNGAIWNNVPFFQVSGAILLKIVLGLRECILNMYTKISGKSRTPVFR